MMRLRVAAVVLLACAVCSRPPRGEALDLRRSDRHIAAERHVQAESGTFVVYGDGTGLWNHRLQFRVGPSALARMSELVEASRFRDMPEAFGQGRKWLVRRVAVEAADLSKQVVQLRGGEESKDLRDLTDQLFAIVSPLAREGITAVSLQDGLRKVAAGELAPQTLRLIAHVKPSPGQGAAGFLVRIEDGRVTRQEYREGAYTDTRGLPLTAQALREVAGILADGDPATLPANVHSDVYRELVVQVLDRRKSVLARGYTGPAAPGQGESRERLERLFARLTARLSPAIANHR
jgi:hypothetical protein